MMPTWNDVATGARWHGVVSLVHNWVGPLSSDQGIAPDRLDVILRAKRLNLPAAVREWYQLTANWEQAGLNVWIRPEELSECSDFVGILTDTEEINLWGIRVGDFGIEDPPVVSDQAHCDAAFPSFSAFVGAMIANDVIFDYESEAPMELDPSSVRSDLVCLVASSCGDFLADAPFESATVLVFAYPENGPAFGISRTPSGRELLRRLQRKAT